MDFAEADESQAGKGFRHKLVTAAYNETPSIATQKEGGVGSFDESVGEALLKGRPFIKLDNLRDKLNSTTLESVLTADPKEYVLARGFRKQGDVRADVYLFQASSNGAQGTRDIANRSCVIRIRKRPDGYKFKKFEEGDMLDRVRAKQGRVLGAIHMIIEDWIKRGKPESEEGRQDFRKWARKLDWIMTNIFKMPGMLDGHREIQTRVSTPFRGVLRDLAIAASKASKPDVGMSATDLIKFAEDQGVEILGLRGKDEQKKARWLGTQIGNVFKEDKTECLRLEGFVMVRHNERVRRQDGQGYFDVKHYQFRLES